MFKHAFRTNPRFRALSLLFVAFLLPPSAPAAAIEVAVQERRTFEFDGVRFSNDFPGARLNDCRQVGELEFEILIQPENTPINNSAWYAFQVVSDEPQTLTVTLTYENGRHRYHPKISRDGVNWTPLAGDAYTHDTGSHRAILTLNTGPRPLWIAAQEMIGARELDTWTSRMARRPFVTRSLLGHSLENRPIHLLEITQSTKRNYIFIIGRQHPPELTGTIGLMHFTEALAGNSRLAEEFRRHFRTIVIPLMNPDGVYHGHWRHNLGGVDLNRDWRDFNQPEPRLARDHFIELAGQPDARAWLLLDFHSTRYDIFYTQTDDDETFPENFTADWLGMLQDRFPDYNVRRSGSHNSRGTTSKVWGYVQFGIPSITYEFGDDTDRALIRRIAAGAAEEMMRLLLRHHREERTVEEAETVAGEGGR